MGGIIGSVIGGISGSNATSDSNQGLNNANNIWSQYLQNIQNQEQPYSQAGAGAITQLGQLLGTTANNGTTGSAYGSLTQPFSTADFQSDPGYQFRLQQGQQAVNAANAAQGISPISGAGLKGLDAYTQGLASQDYQQAYQNYQTNQNNTYSRLMGLTGVGQNANSAINTAYTNTANAQSGIANAIGNNYAANDLNQGNAWATGLTSGLGLIGGFSSGFGSSGSQILPFSTQSGADASAAANGIQWNNSSSSGGADLSSLLPLLATLA